MSYARALNEQLKAIDLQYTSLLAKWTTECQVDEQAVVSGQLDKQVYIEQDKKRTAQFEPALKEIEAQAKQLISRYVFKFHQVTDGQTFNLLNDKFEHDYLKLSPWSNGVNYFNAKNLVTGQECWIVDTVTVVTAEGTTC